MIARHRRSYERDDFVFDPIHYLPLLERKTGALDQAAPLAGWELPEEFGVLRRLLESRMGRRGKREFVQVLRLMENFRKEEVYGVRARCPQARRHKLRRHQEPRYLDFLAMPSVNKHLVMQLARCEYVDRRENVIAIGNSGTARPMSRSAWGSQPARGTVGRLHHSRLAGPRADRGQGRATAAQPPEEACPTQAAYRRRAWLRPTLQDRRGAPLRGLQPEIRERVGPGHHQPAPSTSGLRSSALRGLTGALLDRLTHRVHILEMNGESYRLKQSRLAATTRSAGDSPDA